MAQAVFDRDRVLQMDDDTLSRECVFESFKATGNGGQKRNKTSSAVRVRHLPTGVVAEDASERSWFRNRETALRKLRMRFSLLFRQEPGALPRLRCAPDHADYPYYRALLLDALASSAYEPKKASEILGMSPSALVKILFRDPELWAWVLRERIASGKTPLRGK